MTVSSFSEVPVLFYAALAESTSTTTPMSTVTDIAKTSTTTPKNSKANKSSSTISSNIQNNGNIAVSTSLPRSVSHIPTNRGKIKLHLSSAEGPTITYPISLPGTLSSFSLIKLYVAKLYFKCVRFL